MGEGRLKHWDMEKKKWVSLSEIGNPNDGSNRWEKVWKVDEDGTMECLLNGYRILGSQIIELNWIEVMAAKCWCDLRFFLPAYCIALRKVGVSTIDVSDLYFDA